MTSTNRTRDAFDDWAATEPQALRNLTIAEIWMAAYDQAREDLADEAQEWAEEVIRRMPNMPDSLAAAPTWQPIVHSPAHLCGHVRPCRVPAGWATDCLHTATFIRSRSDGSHDYSCAIHVNSPSWLREDEPDA